MQIYIGYWNGRICCLDGHETIELQKWTVGSLFFEWKFLRLFHGWEYFNREFTHNRNLGHVKLSSFRESSYVNRDWMFCPSFFDSWWWSSPSNGDRSVLPCENLSNSYQAGQDDNPQLSSSVSLIETQS